MAPALRPGIWDRPAALDRLASETFDVLVVGGGITGAGVARDAALRGLRTAIVDAGDWAAGTSSRTTKLAHGGLRYLELLDFRLVRTALAERAVLLSIAPHFTWASPFLLPIYPGRSRSSWELKVGLRLYDALAGRARLGRHQMLDAAEALEREPVLSPRGLRGAAVYWDARVRDARLVIETIADARRAGAEAANYCSVEDVDRAGGLWSADVHDRRTGERFAIHARACVNATGAWTDRLRRRVAPGREPLLLPSKGIHCVVARERLALRDPTALFAADGRLFFAVPAGAWTYIGTTDTMDGGDVDDLSASPDDVRYLVEATAAALAEPLTLADVVGTWAAWRPLVRRGGRNAPSRISRDEVVETTAPGFLTIAGGKLTTYRAMAEHAVDRLLEQTGLPRGACVTAARPLVPAHPGGDGPPPGIDPDAASRARGLFGPDAEGVFAHWRDDPESAEPLASDFPFSSAEVDRVAREMVETLDDLVDRRLLGLPGGVPVSTATLARVAEVAGQALGWGAARREHEVARFRTGVERWPARTGRDLPRTTAGV